MYALYILLKTFNIQTPQYSASQQSLKILIFTPPTFIFTHQAATVRKKDTIHLLLPALILYCLFATAQLVTGFWNSKIDRNTQASPRCSSDKRTYRPGIRQSELKRWVPT